MIEQARDFREESETLHAVVADLPEADFDRPTQFKGWTINDVLGHLHFWNVAADRSLTDERAFDRMLAPVMARLGKRGLRQAEDEWLGGLRGHALREAWRAHYLDMAARWAEADPRARVKWAGPSMSARSSISARIMETWAHGQEVFDLLGLERKETDRIRNVVVLGVNAYGWSFRVRGEEPPAPMPRLRLTAPSGAVWEFGEGPDLIEGSAVEFCQVVTQTRNVADTALRVVGSTAERWMRTAQCFAGPPETPPAPGTRGPARR